MKPEKEITVLGSVKREYQPPRVIEQTAPKEPMSAGPNGFTDGTAYSMS